MILSSKELMHPEVQKQKRADRPPVGVITPGSRETKHSLATRRGDCCPVCVTQTNARRWMMQAGSVSRFGRSEDRKIRRLEDRKVSRSEDQKIRRSEDQKIGRSEDQSLVT